MNEQFISFIDTDVEANENSVEIFAKVCGAEITNGTIQRVNNAISDYKREENVDYDSDGCLEAAKEQLEKEGYKVEFITPSLKIYF